MLDGFFLWILTGTHWHDEKKKYTLVKLIITVSVIQLILLFGTMSWFKQSTDYWWYSVGFFCILSFFQFITIVGEILMLTEDRDLYQIGKLIATTASSIIWFCIIIRVIPNIQNANFQILLNAARRNWWFIL